MRIYARIESGAVAELLGTDQDITELFHPTLHWVEVTGQPVHVGWVMSDQGFGPPSAAPEAPMQPTLAQLQAQLNELATRLAALVAQG